MAMTIAIDLGTTNSAVAMWQDGEAKLIPNSLGDMLTPSAVSVMESGEVIVGLAARERLSTHPELSTAAFKRYIGTDRVVKLGKTKFRAEDLSALVLASLREDAERYLGQPVEDAVITVPAYFNDAQRRATRRAAQQAGLEVDRLINEPTAAALAYGIHELDEEEPFLVFDLGGGTFDVSIVEIFHGIIEVRASAGDPQLGGIDFNEALMHYALEKMPEQLAAHRQHDKFQSALREAAERTRRALSESAEAELRLNWQGEAFAMTLTEAEMQALAKPLIERLREPLLRALRDGNITAEALRDVVLVGGATRMPIVRKEVTRLFGRFPNHRLHPDHAVALGAAVFTGLRGSQEGLKEIRMTDVCPFTLGVDTTERDRFGNWHQGIFAPIIERNRTIPTSRVQQFSTLKDGQEHVEFGIYQGEARNVSDNVKLGQVKVKVPRKPAGQVAIDCRFTYDPNGLLEVDIEVPETGLKKQLVIGGEEEEPGALEKRRKALAKLKVHPRDKAENAAVMARAQRCFEGLIGEQRDILGRYILEFEGAMDHQDERAIEEVRGALSELLDAIDDQNYL
ncbi:MAG: Hsp70 family protein [Pseudomonadota bacterium]